ncbi:SGNH/GDSL hydrolase family protein [Zooshikella ganghwensis]|uniref:SGNH/GDSL hydrolase family protein n=1 Tax=Zooshikella ganghwensis TaxID=202772 RepID=UPI00042888D3|nr:SGNH/GDSL hydrolase family protein [Zooshikella ganghwensis]
MLTALKISGRERKLRVFLIGDSIRLNSEKYVVKNLSKDSYLSSPSENCESSIKVKENLDSWLSRENFDLIHLNCGLHDVRYNPGQKGPVCSKKRYCENLESIFGRLAQRGSSVIWATSTPIDEIVHNAVKDSRRFLKDIIEYNMASIELAKKYNFRVNDLYNKTSTQVLSDILLPDGIHFNEVGNAKIGTWISNAINETLSLLR